VRYDGGEKHNPRLAAIAAELERVAVCPEAELGLGVPRPPMHLSAGDDGRVRLIVTASGEDLTGSMLGFAERRIAELGPLDGYVLKAKSPSCALLSAPLGGGTVGAGLFAATLMARRPLLPVCEESALDDAELARGFVRRVFAAWRLRELFAGTWTVGELVAHHTDHKLLLFSRDPHAARRLGALVARAAELAPQELQSEYSRRFVAIVAEPSRPGREVDALQHCVGWLGSLTAEERAGIHERIAAVADGRLSAFRVANEIRALAERYQVDYLLRQHYLTVSARERRALERCEV